MTKQLLVLGSLLIAAGQLGLAAACGSGTLADYIALGSAGCTIGNNTLNDFGVVNGVAGAIAIPPTAVTITPFGGAFNPGITAGVSQTANNNIREAIFTYRISGSLYTGDSITLGGSSETGNGAVSDVQNFCAGGTFGSDGVTGCTGTPGALALVDGVLNHDSAKVGPIGLISVTDDFTLDGSLGGSASAGSITDQFAAVPEPSTLLLAGVAFALGAGIRLRSRCGGPSRK